MREIPPCSDQHEGNSDSMPPVPTEKHVAAGSSNHQGHRAEVGIISSAFCPGHCADTSLLSATADTSITTLSRIKSKLLCSPCEDNGHHTDALLGNTKITVDVGALPGQLNMCRCVAPLTNNSMQSSGKPGSQPQPPRPHSHPSTECTTTSTPLVSNDRATTVVAGNGKKGKPMSCSRTGNYSLLRRSNSLVSAHSVPAVFGDENAARSAMISCVLDQLSQGDHSLHSHTVSKTSDDATCSGSSKKTLEQSGEPGYSINVASSLSTPKPPAGYSHLLTSRASGLTTVLSHNSESIPTMISKQMVRQRGRSLRSRRQSLCQRIRQVQLSQVVPHVADQLSKVVKSHSGVLSNGPECYKGEGESLISPSGSQTPTRPSLSDAENKPVDASGSSVVHPASAQTDVLKLRDVRTLSTAHLVNLVHTMQGSKQSQQGVSISQCSQVSGNAVVQGKPSPSQPWVSASSACSTPSILSPAAVRVLPSLCLDAEKRKHMAERAASMSATLHHLDEAMDSDATESSSGSDWEEENEDRSCYSSRGIRRRNESSIGQGEEVYVEVDGSAADCGDPLAASFGSSSAAAALERETKSLPALPLRKRCEWKYLSDRGMAASKMAWLNAQITDLYYKITHERDLYANIRTVKRKISLQRTPTYPVSVSAPSSVLSRHGVVNVSASKPAAGSVFSAVCPKKRASLILSPAVSLNERLTPNMTASALSLARPLAPKVNGVAGFTTSLIGQPSSSVSQPTSLLAPITVTAHRSTPFTISKPVSSVQTVVCAGETSGGVFPSHAARCCPYKLPSEAKMKHRRLVTLAAAADLMAASNNQASGYSCAAKTPTNNNNYMSMAMTLSGSVTCSGTPESVNGNLQQAEGSVASSLTQPPLCRCTPPLAFCAVCMGHHTYSQALDTYNMTRMEKVALLDPSSHPVLSFDKDVKLDLRFESLLQQNDYSKQPSPKASGKRKDRKPKNVNGSVSSKKKTSKAVVPQHILSKYSSKDGSGKSSLQPPLSPTKKRHGGAAGKVAKKVNNKLKLKQLAGKKNKLGRGGRQRQYKRMGDQVAISLDYTSTDAGSSLLGSQQSGGHNASSMVAGSMSLRGLHASQRRRAFDVDDIVIPASMASSMARVEKIAYKEIITPKWRESEPTAVTDLAPAVPVHPETDLELADAIQLDLSEDIIAVRHMRCEQAEKKRYAGVPPTGMRGRRSRPASMGAAGTFSRPTSESTSEANPHLELWSESSLMLGGDVTVGMGGGGVTCSAPLVGPGSPVVGILGGSQSSLEDPLSSLGSSQLGGMTGAGTLGIDEVQAIILEQQRRRSGSFTARARLQQQKHWGSREIEDCRILPWPRRVFPLCESEEKMLTESPPPTPLAHTDYNGDGSGGGDADDSNRVKEEIRNGGGVGGNPDKADGLSVSTSQWKVVESSTDPEKPGIYLRLSSKQ